MEEDEECNEELRRYAERTLRHKKEYKLPSIALKDISSLIHELQVHQIELEMQNEELHRSQIATESMNRKYFDLYNFAPIAYFSCDQKGMINDVNLEGASLLGQERCNLFQTAFIRFFTPDSRKIFHQHMKKVLDTLEIEKCEVEMLRCDGEPFHAILETMVVINSHGTCKEFRTAVIDITKHKILEEQLQKSLDERELLFAEIRQRVKNNMETMSLLLELHSKYINDEESLEIFREYQNRTKSIAIIHEKLCESDDLKHINFKDYLQKLVNNLKQSYHLSPDIKLILNVEEIYLDINTAIPCSLIINELVSNCMKHTFGNDEGEIYINFQSVDNQLKLKVKDTSNGFSEIPNNESIDSLSLEIVNNLVSQLNGTINLENSKGTEFKIEFQEKEYCKL